MAQDIFELKKKLDVINNYRLGRTSPTGANLFEPQEEVNTIGNAPTEPFEMPPDQNMPEEFDLNKFLEKAVTEPSYKDRLNQPMRPENIKSFSDLEVYKQQLNRAKPMMLRDDEFNEKASRASRMEKFYNSDAGRGLYTNPLDLSGPVIPNSPMPETPLPAPVEAAAEESDSDEGYADYTPGKHPAKALLKDRLNTTGPDDKTKTELSSLRAANEPSYFDQAMQRSAQLSLGEGLLQGMTTIAQAVGSQGRVKADAKIDVNTEAPLESIMFANKAEQARLQLQDEKAKADPKSAISAYSRSILAESLKASGIDIAQLDDLSYSQLEKIYPSLTNLINTRTAAAAKKEAAIEKDLSNKEARRDKIYQKALSKRDDFNKELEKKDGVYQNLLRANTSIKNLEEGLKKPNGFRDAKSIYDFITNLDPESVVREGELAFLSSATDTFKDKIRKFSSNFGDVKQSLTPQQKVMMEDMIKEARKFYGTVYTAKTALVESKLWSYAKDLEDPDDRNEILNPMKWDPIAHLQLSFSADAAEREMMRKRFLGQDSAAATTTNKPAKPAANPEALKESNDIFSAHVKKKDK